MKPSSPRGSIKPDAGPERALFRILGMIATCLGALSGQAPKPAGAAPLARGLDGESALRAIMANAMGRSSWNATGTGLSRKSDSGAKHLATPRQPVRPVVVTHVFGTFRYLCLRSGQESPGGGACVCRLEWTKSSSCETRLAPNKHQQSQTTRRPIVLSAR